MRVDGIQPRDLVKLVRTKDRFIHGGATANHDSGAGESWLRVAHLALPAP
jgi:hypothetical protein